jgi:hypothetical protein
VEREYRFIAKSIFGGVLGGEHYALIISCSDVVDFLKSSETGPVIGLILIAIGIEPECRSVSRSLSGRSPKGEHITPITARSEMTDLLRWLEVDPVIGLIHDNY